MSPFAHSLNSRAPNLATLNPPNLNPNLRAPSANALDARSLTSDGLKTGLAWPALTGTIGSLVLLILLVVWAQVTMLNGSVTASGQVAVRGQNKMVQNLDGGIVAEIDVADGDVVKAGDVLMRLDPTLLKVNLDIARARLAEALARKTRLEAEQLGQPVIDFAGLEASGVLRHLDGLSMDRQYEGQRQIFLARREVQHGLAEQLHGKIEQFNNQIKGLQASIASKDDQLGYIRSELANVVDLNKNGLARESQVLDLQRSQSEMMGQIAQDQSEQARISNSIHDVDLAIVQGEREFKEKVVTDLREATTQSDELILQIVTTQKQLDRVEMRAPMDGVVHELQVTTVGGVVPPGATVMQIVPLAQGLEFDLRLDPRSVDQVYVGQRARIHFPAFSQRTTPEIYGTLTGISPTSITDQASGRSFYRLRLTIPPDELARLGDRVLVPGMPVDAALQTSEHSALAYLLKPLSDQMARAFQDD